MYTATLQLPCGLLVYFWRGSPHWTSPTQHGRGDKKKTIIIISSTLVIILKLVLSTMADCFTRRTNDTVHNRKQSKALAKATCNRIDSHLVGSAKGFGKEFHQRESSQTYDKK